MSKYGTWTRGEDEALLNILGGDDVARKILRGELRITICPPPEPEAPPPPPNIDMAAAYKALGMEAEYAEWVKTHPEQDDPKLWALPC